MLCHAFKGCALPHPLLFHALFLSPIQAHKVASTIFWRDNQKIAGLGREILYNIQPPGLEFGRPQDLQCYQYWVGLGG